MAEGNDIIYYFLTQDGFYVGKKAGLNYVEYHIDNAMKQLFGQQKKAEEEIAWDHKFRDSIYEYGFKNCNYILSTGYCSVEEVKSQVIKKVGKGGQNFWNNLCNMWQKGDKEVAEALCILLAAKHNKDAILNTQIDFMQRVNLKDPDVIINQLLTKDAVKNRWNNILKKLSPKVFLTFDPNDFTMLKTQKVNKYGHVVLQLLGNPKVSSTITKKISEHTYGDVKRQLRKRLKELKPHLDDLELLAESIVVKRAIKEINDWEKNPTEAPHSYPEIFNELNNLLKDARSGLTRRKKFKALIPEDNEIDAFIDALKIWFNNTKLGDIFKPKLNDHWFEDGSRYYKRQLCKWFSEEIFKKNFPFNQEYNEELYRRLENQQFSRSHTDKKVSLSSENTRTLAFAKIFAQMNGLNGTPENLKSQAKKQTNKYNIRFFETNWENIYFEQVTYWLSTEKNAFVINKRSEVSNFNSTPDPITSAEDIQYY